MDGIKTNDMKIQEIAAKQNLSENISMKEYTPPYQNGFLLLTKYRGALMGFAALWIFIFHEWIPLFDEYHIKLFWIENYIKRIGFCGVDIFLFLSGMGLTYSISKAKSISSFYYRRIKRILFPFLTVAALRCYFEQWSMDKFLKNISGINFFQDNILSFLWFVTAIAIFYLLFPLYYKLFIKASGKISFTLCAIILWLIATLYIRDSLRGDLFGFTNRIPVFLIGILAGWLAQNTRILFDRLAWIMLAFTQILGLYLAYLSTFENMYLLVPLSNCCVPNLLISISFPFLFARFMEFLSRIKYIRLVESALYHFLSFFGVFTLELYCVQEWLGEYIIPRIAGQYSALTVNAAVFLIVTLAALILYRIAKYFWMLLDWMIPKITAFRPHIAKRLTELKN